MRLHDIPNYSGFTKIEPIAKGLSADHKFYVETTDGRFLLRVSDIWEHDSKKAEFERMQHMANLDVPMPRPIAFGVYADGNKIFQLTTWCEGKSLESILTTLPETEQYVAELKVGKILRKIHSISAPEGIGNWQERYVNVIGERIQTFYDCGIRFDGWENIIKYYEDNLYLLRNRPQMCLVCNAEKPYISFRRYGRA